MPLTAFLKIDDIPGESHSTGHEEEIDVHALRWGVEHTVRAQVGRGRARARADVDQLALHKFYDAASPYLFLACAQGKSFAEMTLAVRKDSGEAHLDYLIITMENVVIADVEMSNTDDSETEEIHEVVKLAFENVTIKYITLSDDHSAGDEHEITYDIAAGV